MPRGHKCRTYRHGEVGERLFEYSVQLYDSHMRSKAEIKAPKRGEVTTKENEVSVLAGQRQP